MTKNLKLFMLLLGSLLLVTLISCDLTTTDSGGGDSSGGGNDNKTVNANDLEDILHTLSVFEQNYYAVYDFESDDGYIVDESNMGKPNHYYTVRKKLSGNSIQYKTIYNRTNQGAKIELNDWDINDFILSIAFPNPISYFSYFSGKDIELSGDFHRTYGNYGTTVHSTEDDNLEISINTTNYEIVFSYFVNGVTAKATASLLIDDMNYSTELKEFLEDINYPDEEG